MHRICSQVVRERIENLAAIFGDNCSTIRAFDNLVPKILVGCASHRYNLTVHRMFNESKELIKKVNEIMKKLRNQYW